MQEGRVLERVSAFGAAAQSTVPALYAWGVTVAPVSWARGSSMVSKAAALLALAALALGYLGDKAWGGRARVVSLWGFVLSCALAWAAAPAALGPMKMDAPHGLAGMLGWALFALASAAPPLLGPREAVRITERLPARATFRRGDAVYVGGGAVLAAGLQAFGWRVGTPERALLVRLVAIAAGLGVLGVATELAIARHALRVVLPTPLRLRRSRWSILAVAVLALVGLVFVVRC